jgi:prepilin-type N-terminal cleavage/methylation domain-containing protein
MKTRTRGFTLIELMVVLVIIGLLLSLILTAAMGGQRRAEERATQGLITKLETGLMDRLQALLEQRADVNAAHAWIASNFGTTTNSFRRAQFIAQHDYVRAELPDTFLVNTANTDYPINFAAVAYSPGSTTASATVNASFPSLVPHAAFVLPLGNAEANVAAAWPSGSYGADNSANPTGTGIYGASYQARAALQKNLGFLPIGYDGLDNNSNGLIDEFAEGGGGTASNGNTVMQNLGNHKPNTARSEVLYALLVEGQGPLGSVFQPDDFTTSQVRDTDNDGLPEFVDAWGNPLQFYRWPILYHSEAQIGQRATLLGGSQVTFNQPYEVDPPKIPAVGSVFLAREQDPLDPSQQFVAPGWWQGVTPPGPVGRAFFETYFHLLHDPVAVAPTAMTYGGLWDRSLNASFGLFSRRAYYSKALIASAGPDGVIGIYRVPAASISAPNLILEGNALQADGSAYYTASSFVNVTSQATVDLQDAGQDDITNHNIASPGGGTQ